MCCQLFSVLVARQHIFIVDRVFNIKVTILLSGHYGGSLDIVVVCCQLFSVLVARQHIIIHDGVVDKVSNIKVTILLSVCVCEQRVTTESVLCVSCDTFRAQLCSLVRNPCNFM